MARRFFRVGPAIWLKPWTDDTRTVAFYLLTGPHRRTEGLYRLPLEYGRADVGWPAKRFNTAFDLLVRDGFVEHDPGPQVVLLPKALEWQAPANPNQVKAAVKAIQELPPTRLLARFRALAQQHCEPLAKALADALPEPSPEPFREPLPHAVANTPSPSPSQYPPDPPRGEIPEPPIRPEGNRKRDLAAYDAAVAAYAAAIYPDGPEPERTDLVRQALAWLSGAHGMQRTTAHVDRVVRNLRETGVPHRLRSVDQGGEAA